MLALTDETGAGGAEGEKNSCVGGARVMSSLEGGNDRK